MIPDKFWQPWSEIDPSGAHGGLPGELDDFVGARLGDNPQTKNIDQWTIFGAVRDAAASLSMHPYGNVEGPPVRSMVEETLRALNHVLERILDRTRVPSTNFFQWTHAVPPNSDLAQRPIRFPLRNEFAHRAVYHFLGDLVEIAESNVNAMHSCLDPSSSQRILAPFFHLKANIMKDYFDVEAKGEVTLDELQVMFSDITRPGPTIVPAGETHPLPTPEQVVEALAGADLVQWFPDESNWQVFGRKNTEMYKAERIWQPEDATSTTEDVAPGHPIRPGSGVSPG